MDGVILAAGAGTRMHDGLNPLRHKALSSLQGMSVIERGMRAMWEAGVDRVIVVTGHAEGVLRRGIIDDLCSDIPVEFVYSHDWKRGNGSSLYAARNMVNGDRFVLAMSDHWYEPSVISKLLKAGEESAGSLLGIDRNVSALHDPVDATKVSLSNAGHVTAIDKDLEPYDAADCGIFLLEYEVFQALERSFRNEDYSLTGGVRYLVQDRNIGTVDLTGSLWEDIDTVEGLASARRKLRRSLVSPEDGLVAKFINRRVSLGLTGLAVRAGFTPNMVSLIAVLLAMSAAVGFAVGALIPAAILVQLSSIVDGTDGEVARTRFMSSPWGGLLDSILDRLSDAMMYAGAGLYLLQDSATALEIIAVVGVLGGAPMSMMLKDRYRIATGRTWRSGTDDGAGRLLFATRDGRLFLLMAGGLTGQLLIALLYTAGASLALLTWRLATAWREFRTEPEVTHAVGDGRPVAGI